MMAGLGAVALRLLSQYLVQILAGLAIVSLYFAWEHHVQALQKEKDVAALAKRDAKTAEDSAKLMAVEKEKVEQSNKEKTERLQDAITIYATRTGDLNDDVDNLTKRLRNSGKAASCGQNSVPGRGDDNRGGKGSDHEEDQDIAKAAIELANLCEEKINELKVKN